MKILITGITGFIGNDLAKVLLERGHEVFGINHPTHVLGSISKELLARIANAKLYYGDINDYLTIRRIYEKTQPDVIVHLAAHTSVEYSFYRAHETIQSNFFGTINMAEAAREVLPNLKKFIFSGTAEEYGNQEQSPLKEEFPLLGASPYGVAKISAEHYLKYLHSAYDFPCIIFRNTNTYGRKHNDYFVVEKIIVEMLQKKKKIQMGNPEPIRDFIYVDDMIDAYVKAIETDKNIFGESINLSTGEGIKIQDLTEKIKGMVGWDGEIEWKTVSHRPCEIWSLVLDNSKAKRLLDWQPKYILDDGLRKTVDWWKNKVNEKTLVITMDETPKTIWKIED